MRFARRGAAAPCCRLSPFGSDCWLVTLSLPSCRRFITRFRHHGSRRLQVDEGRPGHQVRAALARSVTTAPFWWPVSGWCLICLKAPPFVQDIALLCCFGTRAMPRISSGSIQSHGVMRKQSESDSRLNLLTRIAMHKGMDPYLRERVMSGMGPGINQGREACAGHMPVRFVRRMSADTHTLQSTCTRHRDRTPPHRDRTLPHLFQLCCGGWMQDRFSPPIARYHCMSRLPDLRRSRNCDELTFPPP